MALFLASPMSDYITGTHVVVDGGALLVWEDLALRAKHEHEGAPQSIAMDTWIAQIRDKIDEIPCRDGPRVILHRAIEELFAGTG